MEMTVSGARLLRETIRLQRLTIEPGARLEAPEGMFVQLTVDGIGRKQEPGVYEGDVVLTVADCYKMSPHGLMKIYNRWEDLHTALVITDGKVIESQSTPALVRGGVVTGDRAEGIRIESDEPSFNGILVTGDSDFTVRNARIRLDGMSTDDFAGVGAGIAAIDNARVTIEDSEITLFGETRCAVHVGGDSVVTVNRCRLENRSPDNPAWLDTFSWGFGSFGSNRLTQLCDNGTVYYNDCELRSNGWGIFSIDGGDDAVSVYAKNCRVELTGPHSRGYGGFCIGDRNVVSFDHCQMDISAYPMMVRGMSGTARAEIVNGCDITSREFGVLCFGDKETPVVIADSRMRTESSALVVKGSSTKFHLRNAVLEPGNGVVLQLMDNDETGMDVDATILPIGRTDVYVEGRDLAAYDPAMDVAVELSDMTVRGDFFNSTTELHMERDSVPGGGMIDCDAFGGLLRQPPEGMPPMGEGEEFRDEINYEKALRGAKNLLLELKNARVEGVVSSASEAHRPGVTQISSENRREMSVITQEAAPTVNNGVIVRLDQDSTWLVTGTSYITSLELAPAAILKGWGGKKLRMTVDGEEKPIRPGKYEGRIVLRLEP